MGGFRPSHTSDDFVRARQWEAFLCLHDAEEDRWGVPKPASHGREKGRKVEVKQDSVKVLLGFVLLGPASNAKSLAVAAFKRRESEKCLKSGGISLESGSQCRG